MHDAPRSDRGHRLRLLSSGDRSPEFLVFALMFGLLAAGALLLFAATEEPWLLVAVPVLAILGIVGWVLRRRPT